MAQHQKSSHAKRPTAKKKSAGRKWAIFGTVFLSVVGVLMFAVSGVLWMFQYNRNASLDALSDAQLGVNQELDDKVVNIALFGVDSRNLNAFKGLSDSIMILSIDKVHNSIKITSVLRDSVVPIEGHGVNKINSAYSYGGPELAIKTLNENFQLNIRDYATVNFRGMAEIIDAVGGIEVDITEAERTHANYHITWLAASSGISKDLIQKAGPQTLSGNQAVAFARLRKVSTSSGVSNDFGRTDRQRYVMEQLFNKALSMGVSKYPGLIRAMLPHMETSLSYSDIIGLASVLTGDIQFQQARIPTGYNMTITNKDVPSYLGSVVYYRLDYASDMLHAFIYDDIKTDDYIASNPPNTAPWYTEWGANR